MKSRPSFWCSDPFRNLVSCEQLKTWLQLPIPFESSRISVGKQQSHISVSRFHSKEGHMLWWNSNDWTKPASHLVFDFENEKRQRNEYALILLNVSLESGESFLSGWYFWASDKYLSLISSWVAVKCRPRTPEIREEREGTNNGERNGSWEYRKGLVILRKVSESEFLGRVSGRETSKLNFAFLKKERCFKQEFA